MHEQSEVRNIDDITKLLVAPQRALSAFTVSFSENGATRLIFIVWFYESTEFGFIMLVLLDVGKSHARAHG